MKRYQCIKNYYVTLAYGWGVKTAVGFKAGKPYSFTNNGEYWEVVDEFGTTHIATDGFMTYFQELLDLHVDDIPRDEADREPFTTPEPRRKLTVGWAWFIVLVIMIGFFILKAFTE